MKVYPFASLNHFTVPWSRAMLRTSRKTVNLDSASRNPRCRRKQPAAVVRPQRGRACTAREGLAFSGQVLCTLPERFGECRIWHSTPSAVERRSRLCGAGDVAVEPAPPTAPQGSFGTGPHL